MPTANRKMHKFVTDVSFTPSGGSAIPFPGIKRIEWSSSAKTTQTQTGNSTRTDCCILLGIEDTISLVTEDAELLDLSNIVAGKEGALTWKNVVASTAATAKTFTASNIMITQHGYPMEAGAGPHEISLNFVAWSSDGSTSPISRT